MTSKEKVVALVPVKLNNERLPGKNIKQFSNGTPLITCILDALKAANHIDEIYVYCSDESIKEYLPPGIKYLKRSSTLDSSDTKINEVLVEFSRDIPSDIYVLAHVTAPFLTASSIELGIKKVKYDGHDSALTVHKMQEFMWQNNKPVNYDISAVPRTQDLPATYIETTGLYVYRDKLIKEKNSRIGDNPYLIEVSKIENIDINEPVDFEIADAIFNNLISK